MSLLKKIKTLRLLSLCMLSTSLIACAGFWDKDNTPTPNPLPVFKPQITPRQIWGVQTGGPNRKDYQKLSIGSSANALYVANTEGIVTSINKFTGAFNWRVATGQPLSTGPAYGNGVVVVGANNGVVVAMSATLSTILWQTPLPGTILAQPAVNGDIAIVKTTDGTVHGLSLQTGAEQWAYRETEPNLILHSASAPLLRDNSAVIGFANGNLAKLNASTGALVWERQIAIPEGAFAIQRMIDIDADPIAYDSRIFAATYQGKIQALDWSGRNLWSHDISSYTGMAADYSGVYVSDAYSNIWAIGNTSGFVNWRQTQLSYRNTTGPAIMGKYLVVGDQQGYLHWLNKRDGHFVARVNVGHGIFTPPLVENNVLYAYTNNGLLVAYKLA